MIPYNSLEKWYDKFSKKYDYDPNFRKGSRNNDLLFIEFVLHDSLNQHDVKVETATTILQAQLEGTQHIAIVQQDPQQRTNNAINKTKS